MLERYHKVLGELLKVIRKMESQDIKRDYPLSWEIIHISSCSRVAQILASRRRLNVELAAVAAAIHDYGRIITGKQENHAAAGYEPVKQFLEELEIFTQDEVDLLAEACRNHSVKHIIGNEIEEVVKDSDVLDCYLHGEQITKTPHKKRLQQLLKDFDLQPL